MTNSIHVTVRVQLVTDTEHLHSEDYRLLDEIRGEHSFDINVDEVAPPDASDPEIARLSPNERFEYVIREAALDRFHEATPIKVLEDFEVSVSIPPEEVVRLRRHLTWQSSMNSPMP